MPPKVSIHWFRKGLRLHDNPALIAAAKNSKHVFPIFILDPWFVSHGRIGRNRWNFLAESLLDLDSSLRALDSRLFVVRGKPEAVLPNLIKKWGVTHLTFEKDTEPYALKRDSKIRNLCAGLGVTVDTVLGHTLYDCDVVLSKLGGKSPKSYRSFLGVAERLGAPPRPKAAPSSTEQLPPPPKKHLSGRQYDPPTAKELGYDRESVLEDCPFRGGETEALARMSKKLRDARWVSTFEKPKTSPNALEPSTTVLSPYLKFGCLSPRTMYWRVQAAYKRHKGSHSKPPTSLVGQLLWREFYYACSLGTPNYDKMEGNPNCRTIPWSKDPKLLKAWKNGRTGYPWIDAIMTQLRVQGWIHHLARHSAACFLTRGDLWQSWEDGAAVFDELLLDADWALNQGNWQWLSASAFFHQYFRVYSPVSFGKKTDKSGAYIRKWLPCLKEYPDKYIYEPWKAPLAVQRQAGCVVGKDYPRRIVDHDAARKENMGRMKAAYDWNKKTSNGMTAENGSAKRKATGSGGGGKPPKKAKGAKRQSKIKF
jgi:cryptochrome